MVLVWLQAETAEWILIPNFVNSSDWHLNLNLQANVNAPGIHITTQEGIHPATVLQAGCVQCFNSPESQLQTDTSKSMWKLLSTQW